MPGTQSAAARKGSRENQKARTRAALVAAAAKLVRDGRPPSMPDAAEEALVSVATAYRYFTSAEQLWDEALLDATNFDDLFDEVRSQMEAAGDDLLARAEIAVRLVGGHMIAEQPLYRGIIRESLERWFAQVDQADGAEPVPVRAGRRNTLNKLIVEPLRDAVPEETLERLVWALGLVSGAEIVLSLVDALGLDGDDAMATLLDANRWMITGALAEAKVDSVRPRPPGRARRA